MVDDISVDLNCSTAFTKFQIKFAKKYASQQAKDAAEVIFCEKFSQLQQTKATCPECEVTEIYDIHENHLISNIKINLKSSFWLKALGIYDCNSNWCYATNSIANLKTLPASVDFREQGLTGVAKNQGSCGSCWAFGTVATLESCLLRAKKSYSAPWKFIAKNISLSDQWVLQNCRGNNLYCNGGLGDRALWQLSSQQQTVELSSNFPYNPTTANNKSAIPKVSSKQYMKPFVQYTVSQNKTQTTGAVLLFLNWTSSFNTTSITTIKSYLARGFPVLGTMYVGQSASTFYSYNGMSSFGSAYSCKKFNLDHQVTFVGYGKKGGKDVWIMKNSWGTGWGSQGFFYMQIGTDPYCMEHYAFGVVPKYATIDSIAYTADGDTAFSIPRGTSTCTNCIGLDKN